MKHQLKKGQTGPRFFIYILGLFIMSLGIVLLIKADLGATPWDALHVGLYYQLGLSIGSWSIIVGFIILASAAVILKEWPKVGAFLNMVLVGVFIDMFFLLPFLQTPEETAGKLFMFIMGIIINAYGMGIYISAKFGAGPRDSLMIAVSTKTGLKIKTVRAVMEVIVLCIGWILGGPIFVGTVLYGLAIGPLAGYTLPQCQYAADRWLQNLRMKKTIYEQSETQTKRGASL